MVDMRDQCRADAPSFLFIRYLSVSAAFLDGKAALSAAASSDIHGASASAGRVRRRLAVI
jgi:hypothetical protein